jgi:hypothetical protein
MELLLMGQQLTAAREQLQRLSWLAGWLACGGGGCVVLSNDVSKEQS